MDRFFLIVSLIVTLCCSCGGQMIEEEQDILIMKTVFKQNQKILDYIEGQQEKIASLEDVQRTIMESLRGQQEKLTTLEVMQGTMMQNLQEMQKTIEDTQREQDGEIQLCAKQDQVNDFKNAYESGKQDIMTSLERSSCNDQLLDLQDLLTADECEDGSHNCSEVASCSDELILYKCTCHPGYFGDGFTCTDVDECHEGDATCGANERCTNNPGSYECICLEGYEMGDSGCLDIDECQRGQHQCQSPTSCVNIDGNFECQCLPPYKKNGVSCVLSCMSPSLYMEDLGCIKPILTRMNWLEAKAECERLGMRLVEDLKKKHFDTLTHHFMPLRSREDDVWIGFKNKLWLSSGHPVSSELLAIGEGTLEDECGTLDMRSGDSYGLYDMGCNNIFNAFCQTIP